MKLEDHKDHVEDFVLVMDKALELSCRDRDYYDNKQWAAEQAAKLEARGQAPIVDNKIKPKVEDTKGIALQRITDPKAFPRNHSADEEGSEAVTDALRYVSDVESLDEIFLQNLEEIMIEGYTGCIVRDKIVKRKKDVSVEEIPWDRIYFDTHSRKKDFSDARWMGLFTWLEAEDVKAMYPDKSDDIDQLQPESMVGRMYSAVFSDRPRWLEVKNGSKRLRVAEEYYLEGGKWYKIVFCGDLMLQEPKISPYLDEDGEPENPMELRSAYVDRENQRYGEARFWIDPQNEINHRRSKALHFLSNRQTTARKGAIEDVAALKRELAKPDGHVEYQGDQGDFEILQTGDMAQGQLNLLALSYQSLNDVSSNITAATGQRPESAPAIDKVQQAEMLRLNSIFAGWDNYKQNVYRKVWNRIKQYWKQEKWVRVMDDYQKLRWVGFNVNVTAQQYLQETAENKSLPMEARIGAQAMLQEMTQNQDPRLQEMVAVKNPVPELDMDIILEEVPNSVNIQQEQFRLMAELAKGNPQIPFKSLLKLSNLRDKDSLIAEIEQGEQQAQAGRQEALQLENLEKVSKIRNTDADTQKKMEEAGVTNAKTTNTQLDSIIKQLEAVNLQMNPDPEPQVIT